MYKLKRGIRESDGHYWYNTAIKLEELRKDLLYEEYLRKTHQLNKGVKYV